MSTPGTVSIITATYNTGPLIGRALRSVAAQTHRPVEHIIVDGGSTDETLNIVRDSRPGPAHIISEPDKGISDAFNKGVRIAGGEYLQFLGGNDYLPDNFCARAVSLLQNNPAAGFVFGDVILISPGGDECRVPGNPEYHRSIRYVMRRLNHPTVVARRDLFERTGMFDLRWRIAMDYDWLLRAHLLGFSGVYSPDLTVFMESGGISQRNAVQAFAEGRDISILHGFPPIGAHLYYYLRMGKHKLLRQAGRR